MRGVVLAGRRGLIKDYSGFYRVLSSVISFMFWAGKIESAGAEIPAKWQNQLSLCCEIGRYDQHLSE